MENGLKLTAEDKQYFFSYVASSFVWIIPFLANVLTLKVLSQPRIRQDHPTFRTQLLLLTWAEVIFAALSLLKCSWLSLENLVILPNVHCGKPCAAFSSLLLSVTQSAHGLRNWMMAIITVARFETVLRPLAHLRRKLMITSRMKVVFVIAWVLCLIHSLTKEFHPMYNILCYSTLAENAYYRQSNLTGVRKCFLILQMRGLPILVTLLATCGLLVALLRTKHAHVDTRRHKIMAAKTALALAICFAVLEGLGCSFKIAFYIIQKSHSQYFQFLNPLIITDIFLVLCNSLTNIFALMFCNPTFRNELKKLFKMRSTRVNGL